LSASRRALIVGAGIGGLAAAITLRRAGWDVRVLERAHSPRELGFALALAPNALKALREIGLADAVAREGAEVQSFAVYRADGSLLKRVNFRAGGTDMRSVVTLRPALHGALLTAAGSDTLLLGHDVSEVATTSDGVAVTLGDGRVLHAGVVVGADGVGSSVRRRLHPGEPAARPSGYHALRGVTHDAAQAMAGVNVAVLLGEGIEAGFARASATAVYWYCSLVDEYAPPHATAAQVLARCTHQLDPRFAAIAHAARPEDMRLEPLLLRSPIAEWGRGRVTLLGDAAHPVLPHTAQGAALALEDAVALGLVLGRQGDPEAALRLYERVRSKRTRQVVRAGPRIAALTTTRSRVRIAARNAAIRLLPGIVLSGTLRLHARDPHRQLRQHHQHRSEG
jgi:2-polyprenyl-6-methoxyphenol hydroxylase-like FAD-dependent oxidoreductase